jgi:hypothetical protein
MAPHVRSITAIGRLTALVVALGTCCWLVFSHESNVDAAVYQPISSDANLEQLVRNSGLVALGKSVFEDKNLCLQAEHVLRDLSQYQGRWNGSERYW